MTNWVRPPAISEREGIHYWPDGEYDGPEDEDCVFVAGLEQKLAHAPHSAAATLAEAELIRHAAGLHPSGGASSADLVRGEEALFGWAPSIVTGWEALWTALVPGKSATVSGIPTGAPAGSPIRRFLPNYAKPHRLWVGRYDSTDRVLMLDPEVSADALKAGYKGQWVTKADLKSFATEPRPDGKNPVHTVASMAVVKYTRKVISNGGYLWTLPRATAGSVKKQALVVGQVATITGGVAGGAWSFAGLSGTIWFRISEINEVKLPVPLYGAKGRFG